MCNNLLVEVQEDNVRSKTKMTVYASHGGEDAAKAMVYRLLKSPMFRDVLQQVVNEENMTTQPLDGPAISGGQGQSHSYQAKYKDHYFTAENKKKSTTSDAVPELPPAVPPPAVGASNGLERNGGSLSNPNDFLNVFGVV